MTLFAAAATAFGAELPYKVDFEKAQVGSVPEDFLVLDGAFAVKEESGNKALELPGAPLDTFGVLFGPSVKENATVSARIWGEGKGRRFPTFDVGLNGVGGYRLRVSPGKKQLELFRSDALKKAVPLEWKPGQWTHLKLTVIKASEGKWVVSGKIWEAGTTEPAEASIQHEENEAPPAGRASVFGSPYSGSPIRFDDFLVEKAGK